MRTLKTLFAALCALGVLLAAPAAFCQDCPEGETDCNGTCVNLATDMNHCGACDQPCVLPNAREECVDGVCVVVSCNSPYGDCDGDDVNGCESNLNSDVANCSACGERCGEPGTASQCRTGSCVPSTNCLADFLNCDADDGNGCEVHPSTDPDNCGGCGIVCDVPNATPGCEASACTVGTCDENFGDCDGSVGNGCEVELLVDEDYCGDCSTACAANETCINGVCCGDTDGDGFEAPECGGEDCNDADANTNPNATEICDGVDNDCNGLIDEDFDADGDGYTTCGDAIDCNDDDPGIHPGSQEVCGNDVDENCDGQKAPCSCVDADGDGHQDVVCGGDDCDDADPAINPSLSETCNDGKDNNCNGLKDDKEVCFQSSEASCGCTATGNAPLTAGVMLLLALMGLTWVNRHW